MVEVEAYCPKCKTKQTMEAKVFITSTLRTGTVWKGYRGKCPVCKSALFHTVKADENE